MKTRLAYTAGGIVLLTGGIRTRIPAGACWIDRHSAAPDFCTIRWSKLGTEYSAQLSREALRAYVLGCLLQYA